MYDYIMYVDHNEKLNEQQHSFLSVLVQTTSVDQLQILRQLKQPVSKHCKHLFFRRYKNVSPTNINVCNMKESMRKKTKNKERR